MGRWSVMPLLGKTCPAVRQCGDGCRARGASLPRSQACPRLGGCRGAQRLPPSGRFHGLRGHLGLHRDVRAPGSPREGGSRGGLGDRQRDLRPAARGGVRERWVAPQVRRRRAAAVLRGLRTCRAGGPRGGGHASRTATHRPREDVGRRDDAEDARRRPQRSVRFLPARTRPSGARRGRSLGDEDRRDGIQRRRRRDHGQRRDGRMASVGGARRATRRWPAAGSDAPRPPRQRRHDDPQRRRSRTVRGSADPTGRSLRHRSRAPAGRDLVRPLRRVR